MVRGRENDSPVVGELPARVVVCSGCQAVRGPEDRQCVVAAAAEPRQGGQLHEDLRHGERQTEVGVLPVGGGARE